MSKDLIIHCMHAEKFIQPFIEFLAENFVDFEARHFFFITGNLKKYSIKIRSNLLWSQNSKLVYYTKLAFVMNKAEKIIIHGLFNMRLIILLAMQPWLLKRCYWVMWGGDLYKYQLGDRNWKWKMHEIFRRPVIKNMGYLVNGTPGDVDLARQWYGAKGEHVRCFNYPSNIYKHYEIKPKAHDTINIQVGNSADPTNQYLEIFDQLEGFKDLNIKIFVVLSYGNQDYAKKVIEEGKKRFGEKFAAITDMMPLDQYLGFLASIDIAIFNHKRQQAFGNTITLLGLGKKVFLNQASTLNGVLNEFGIQIFNSQHIELSPLNEAAKQSNIEKVQHHFSKQSLVKSLQSWIS